MAKSFIDKVRERAEDNTVTFLSVFGTGLFPQEDIEDFEALKRYKDIPLTPSDSSKARSVLKRIKGNLVNYPCTFLVKELTPYVVIQRIFLFVTMRSVSRFFDIFPTLIFIFFFICVLPCFNIKQ